jgi:hypothetical protein
MKATGISSMKKRNISLPSLETGGPYNLCIRHGDLIFISGLPPFDAEFSAQLRNARANSTPMPPFPDLTFEQQVTIVMKGSHRSCRLEHGLPAAGYYVAKRSKPPRGV